MFSRSFLIGLVCGLWALYGVFAAWESPGNRELIRYLIRLWRQLTRVGKFVVVTLISVLTIYGGLKDKTIPDPDARQSVPGHSAFFTSERDSGGIAAEDAPMSQES